MGVSGKVLALTFCGLLSLGIALRETYEGWQVLRVQPKTQEQLRRLHRMYLQNNQVDFWKSARHLGESAEILVPPKYLEQTKSYLQNAGIHVATLHKDISSLVRPEIERLERKSRVGPVKGAAFDYDEFHTYEEVMAEMEDMVTRCPAGFNCETYIIGQSWEGRDQKILKIHKQGQTRPIHWIDTITHAREWLGLAVHLKFVNYLFSNYETDADAKMFLDAGDWYFMFILNPDGYEFTWTDRRLWRKCRFNNSLLREDTDCFGVDLNRN